MTINEAMQQYGSDHGWSRGEVGGEEQPAATLEVGYAPYNNQPFPDDHPELTGGGLLAKLGEWVERGEHTRGCTSPCPPLRAYTRTPRHD